MIKYSTEDAVIINDYRVPLEVIFKISLDSDITFLEQLCSDFSIYLYKTSNNYIFYSDVDHIVKEIKELIALHNKQEFDNEFNTKLNKNLK